MKLSAEYEDGVLIVRPRPYHGDGWFIENRGPVWKLFKPGENKDSVPEFIDNYPSFGAATKAAEKLT